MERVAAVGVMVTVLASLLVIGVYGFSERPPAEPHRIGVPLPTGSPSPSEDESYSLGPAPRTKKKRPR